MAMTKGWFWRGRLSRLTVHSEKPVHLQLSSNGESTEIASFSEIGALHRTRKTCAAAVDTIPAGLRPVRLDLVYEGGQEDHPFVYRQQFLRPKDLIVVDHPLHRVDVDVELHPFRAGAK